MTMRAFLMAIVLASGCGDDAAVSAYHSYIDRVATIRCGAALACCANVSQQNLQTCKSQFATATFGPPNVDDAELRDQVVLFDRTAAQGCVETLQAATSSCAGSVDAAVVDAYFCRAAFGGTLAVGARCGLGANVACSTGATCAPTLPSTTTGTCVATTALPVSRVADGQACTVDDDCSSYHCAGGRCGAALSVTQFLCR